MRRSLLPALLLLPFTLSAWRLFDQSAQTLPFSQNWSNTGLITTDDNWSNVPGVIGCRGDGLTAAENVDPQTVLTADDCAVVDVGANRTTNNTTGGVHEYEITDPVVAFQGSGTADAPYLLFTINTTGRTGINVSYNLRDIDASADDAVQQVALHYRVGNTGNFTNVAAAYVADAATANTATQVTPVSVALPSAADDKAVVQFRIMTTNATGNDELVGVDDVTVTGTALPVELSMFTATTDGAETLLRWTTESETNNAGFAVEHEAGQKWRQLAFVAGRGTTAERSTYSFRTDALTPGIHRFRLRQVDFDGTASYSPVVEVAVALARPLVLDVRGTTVQMSVREAQAVRVEAFDVLGRRVAVLFAGAMGAGETQTLRLGDGLTSGMYVVRVAGERGVESRTLTLR
ncbi:MAG TPA: hypothetical protein VD948_11205 [Rhodothermales bacterium]|nr:hypothetical protein [Rhodothermales bacterium]